MNKKELHEINKKQFYDIINDLLENPTVKKMSDFRQHYTTSCLEHCINVAYYNYIICKKFNLDYVSAARAGLLHDLFLYDWRKKQPGRKRLHAFHHPRIALENSKKLYNLNEKEEDIILKHMWPLTIVLPKYKESSITTLVDKYCTIHETIDYYRNNLHQKRAYRYTYIFFSLLILQII